MVTPDGLPAHAVHLVVGESAWGSVHGLLGDTATIVVCRDVLSVGPLRPAASFDEWCSGRKAYWQPILASVPSDKPYDPNLEMIHDVEHLANADVVVWAGIGTSDQLVLPFLTQLRRWLGGEHARTWLVEIATYGIGIVSAKELRTAQPRELGGAELDAARATWDALLAADASGLDAAAQAARPLPALAATVQRLWHRYPDPTTGLPAWDHTMLQAVDAAGPEVARVIGHALRSRDGHLDPVGDVWLFWRLCRHADVALPAPLVTITLGTGPGFRGTTATLTDAGRDVLAGRANAVTLNGLDDFAAGVHLSSAESRVFFR